MHKVYMIAHFTEAKVAATTGLRDQNFINGMYNHLKDDFDIIKVDASQIDHGIDNSPNDLYVDVPTIGISTLNPSPQDGCNILYLQTAYPVINDVAHSKLVYFHIDGQFAMNSSSMDYGLRMYSAPGRHDYPIHEHDKILYPFVFLEEFKPNREKDIVISCIGRGCDYEKYKDLLERSQFTIIDGYGFISKRVFQALACKTIPIIVTNEEPMYRILGFKESFVIFMHHQIPQNSIVPEGYNLEKMREEGYAFMRKLYSGKRRMKQVKSIMNRVYNQPHTY